MNDIFFFSAPQLKRGPLGGTVTLECFVRSRHIVAVLMLLPSALVTQTSGRSHRWEIAAVAGHVTADGDDFQAIKDAFGYGGIVRARVGGGFSLGVGIHYSDHGLVSLPEHLHIRAWYGEARCSLRIAGSPIMGYVGLRGGPVHEDVTIVNWKANGTVWGITSGLDWQLVSHLGLELQASESALRFGDVRGADGSVISGTAARGSSFNVHAALLVRF